MNYKDILKSDFFNKTYSDIEESKKDFPVNHGFKHISNVISYAKKLAVIFNLNQKERELLLIACSLHDIGYIKGRDNHAENGAIVAREFLEKNNFPAEDTDIICHAIKNHGGKTKECFDTKVSSFLAFADKLDFTKTRYKNDTSSYPAIAPFLNILANDVTLSGQQLGVNVYVNKNFKKEQLAGDYFYNKLIKFLGLLSENLNLRAELKFVTEEDNTQTKKDESTR